MSNTIGFPRESAPGERRTLLTPAVAAALTAAGYEVLAEAGIGAGVFISDAELAAAGVRFVGQGKVWSAGLVLRYKSPDPADLHQARPGQSIGALFHAEGDPRLLEKLISTGVTAYSYEFLCENGRFPLAVAGGQIAGVQAVLHGALALQSHLGGRGVLLAAIDDAPPAQVVVIGSGNVAAAAAATAARLGAQVTVLAHTAASAAEYTAHAPAGVQVVVNTDTARAAALAQADLVIGAILISTYDTPPMITEQDLARMRPGAVIVDATCGYGPGYLPTAGPLQQPGDHPHMVAGIGHVRLDALPALVPVTTTTAYTARIRDYLVRLADVALAGASDPVIDTARIATAGRLVHPVCQQHAAFYNAAATGDASAAETTTVVASYDQRAVFSRAETTSVPRPHGLAQLLATCRHLVEVPCGSGHFLSDYARADVSVTLADANAAMLKEAAEHAHEVGIPESRLSVVQGLLNRLRLPDDVDMVVVPNAALNQLAYQQPLTAVAAALHAAADRTGVQLLAQVAVTTDAGPDTATRFFDPAVPDDDWVADRWFDPAVGGAVQRRRRQRRFGDRLRLEFAYLDGHGNTVHTTTTHIQLLTHTTLSAAFELAGFGEIRVRPGPGGLWELRAVTGRQP
ncbi:class I SAM-dependent methyltransferase [Nocardia asiatica]|uniref:class I SAM-dependent methyltransferase n=1 Tax=Nocardia asiatica TaxID=209252 RepID=UPI00031C5AD6|nr:class I SAM-dependent methyltransferase [Nocardia asiatica]